MCTKITFRKSVLTTILSAFACVVGFGQTPWTTGGNAPSSNCFIGTTNPTPLVLKTDGTERLSLSATGTVKIASLSSADTATVIVMPDGSLGKATDPGTGGGDCNLLIWDGNGNAAGPDCFIGTTNPVAFRVYSNGIERMRVTPAGNVVVQGADAKAAFQVYDHMGVTFNRQDIGLADVVRTIGFNMYQNGATQHHYQLGTAAKMEYQSAAGILQFSVAPSQIADATASFPAGIQLNEQGAVGIGSAPASGTRLFVQGTAKVAQATNPSNFVALSHDGTFGRLESVGGTGTLALVSANGTTSIQQASNANNAITIGHNGTNGFLETAGNQNSKLQINMQSAKTVQFGGDILVANHIGVGTSNFFEGNREYKLCVNGHIRAKAAHVYPAWADYVFQSDYKLMPLSEVATFIALNGRLPGVPSAVEVAADGIDLGEMQAKSLEKIEELTLYLLELKAENEKIIATNQALQQDVDALKKAIKQ